MNIIKKCIRKLERKIYTNKLRKKNKNNNFTIISQNCIGGVIYHDLGLKFLSPTINMFIEDENFVKLCENLQYYMKLKAEPEIENYIDPIDNQIHYPKIKVGDLEMCCLHYKNCAEAVEAWNRRKERINYNNVYIIANTWNLHNNHELIKRLEKLPYKKVVFSTKECNVDGTLCLPGNFWYLDKRNIVRPNITDLKDKGYKRYYEDFFDVVKFLN